MKKLPFIFAMLCFGALAFCAVSCEKNNSDGEDQVIEDETDSVAMANDATVLFPAVLQQGIPADYKTAFNIRFKAVQSAVSSDTKILVVSASAIDSFTGEALKVLNNKGILVILKPSTKVVSDWIKNNNLKMGVMVDLDSCSMYAFNIHGQSYALNFIPEGGDVNGFLNSFVAWTNKCLGLKDSVPKYDSDNVTDLFNYQHIEITYPIHLNKAISHLFNKKFYLDRSGSVDVLYDIYPLYAFYDQGSNSGDYYIVKSTLIVHSGSMYKGRWNTRYKGSRVKQCGYYLSKATVETTLLDVNGSAIGEFPNGALPKPETTIGQTTYTSGFSWNLSGSVTGGLSAEGVVVSASISAGVSFDNSQTRTISDVDILNNSIGSKASYTYEINNLPKYSTSVNITAPPSIAISNAQFEQSWVWKVPSGSENWDNNGTKIFILKNKLAINYMSCWFLTTGLDIKYNHWTDGISGTDSTNCNLVAPSRVPTGMIKITNGFASGYITNITATDNNSKKQYEIGDSNSSIAVGDSVRTYLPVGNYTIKFKAGLTQGSLKTYNLAGGSSAYITIKRAEKKGLNSVFDFKEE
jgi:hypothetical protein